MIKKIYCHLLISFEKNNTTATNPIFDISSLRVYKCYWKRFYLLMGPFEAGASTMQKSYVVGLFGTYTSWTSHHLTAKRWPLCMDRFILSLSCKHMFRKIFSVPRYLPNCLLFSVTTKGRSTTREPLVFIPCVRIIFWLSDRSCLNTEWAAMFLIIALRTWIFFHFSHAYEFGFS